ncbi:MAG: FHA domain-containing protein [Dehalococcoidia bacterium]|nr:FHA domain-containing protein [Dehalococcoidia bacterium]
MKYGLLRVVTSDGRSRDYLIDLPSLIVGRADGNSIVIDDLSVARRHARLTIDSGHLLVEDLGSAEGTFVGGHRIPANAPSLVEANEDVRFGEVGVQYFAPEALQPEPGAAPVSEEARLAEPVAELPEFIRANLAVPPQPIEAGSTPAIAYLTVHNRGRVVDELTVEVLDLPPEWVRISQPRLAVMPDGVPT